MSDAATNQDLELICNRLLVRQWKERCEKAEAERDALIAARERAYALIADNGCDCDEESDHPFPYDIDDPHECLAGRVEMALRTEATP